jgi:hypothetical protein
MTKNHFPWTRLWQYWKWRVWSEPFLSNSAVAEGPSECRVLVPWSAPILKWCFEEEVSLVILLQKKLKENKRKHKSWIYPLLNSRWETWHVIHCHSTIPCFFQLTTLLCRPWVPHSWTCLSFSNKQLYHFFICTMTNKCTIISQIITLLHVSALPCHPQWACYQYLGKLRKYFKCTCC